MEIQKNKSKKRQENNKDNGFGDWGGYMAAKRAKLLGQFKESGGPKLSNIFEGIAIHVNGLTKPPNDELKNLMAAHGGLFHMYQTSTTTHIIASNLPNVKIKHIGTTPVVKPSWITESIEYGKLLDFRRYLLYTNQNRMQPKIEFPVTEKSPPTLLTEKEHPSTSNHSNETIPDTLTIQNNLSIPVSKQTNKTKTASDPNFLEEFYNNSRLHLISTLGAEFKYLVGQMREKSDGIFKGKQKLLALKSNTNPTSISNTVIMHIDMDCFFVSVSLRNHPELKGKPVAITHARNGQLTNIRPDQKANREQEFALYSEKLPVGVTSRVDRIDTQSSLSEIASCSYEARECGIRNGMFLGQAVKMCPDLKTLPYDFEGIKSIAHTLYETISSYTLEIEAVSCDEMYVDITKVLQETGMSIEEWATHIRNEIMTVTRCPCSTGFGANRLQARLATRKAKPEGQYYLKPEDVETYMIDLKLADLPGVGRATLTKLQKMDLYTCGDVQMTSLTALQNEIGQKAGETLKDQSRGIDNRPLNFHHERKSVSAEVNYGIRFKSIEECYQFLQNLSEEVYNRMNDINVRARCLTLKLLVRAQEAPMETAKFLGHGICDSLTKSSNSTILNNPKIIFKEAKILYEKLKPNYSDLRGVGLQLTKLEKNAPVNTALSKFLHQEKVTIKKCLENEENQTRDIKSKVNVEQKSDNKKQKEVPKSINTSKRGRPKGSTTKKKSGDINNFFGKTKNVKTMNETKSSNSQISQQIDMSVLSELPTDLQQEIIKEYNLFDTIKDKKTSKEKVQHEENSNNGDIQRFPFNNLSENQIIHIIKRWIDSGDGPYEVDVEMIAEHFKQLAINRKIEALVKMFNFLFRSFSLLNCKWHEAYFKIVNITQDGMVARYGGTLLVQRKFECCRM